MEIIIFSETIKIDQRAYEELIGRICQSFSIQANFQRLSNLRYSGKGDLIKQLPTLLRFTVQKFPRIKILIIIVDGDGGYPQSTTETKKIIKKKLKDFFQNFSTEIIIAVPTRNIEAWLLTDSHNLSNILGVSDIPVYGCIEDLRDPEKEYLNIYNTYRHNTTDNPPLSKQELPSKIFSTIDLNSLKKYSKSFSNFYKEIKGTFQRLNTFPSRKQIKRKGI